MMENKGALGFILSPIPEEMSDDQHEYESTTSTEEEEGDQALLRQGKWTIAEEEFMHTIVKHFSNGTLPIDIGRQYLRDFLAWQLHCRNMRVTKKLYAICNNLRERRLGRLIYTHKLHPSDIRAKDATESKLQYYREKFLASMDPMDRKKYGMGKYFVSPKANSNLLDYD